jgi:hypothetical protein
MGLRCVLQLKWMCFTCKHSDLLYCFETAWHRLILLLTHINNLAFLIAGSPPFFISIYNVSMLNKHALP